MKTLLIIPAYNEEESLVATIESVQEVVPEIDFLIINDGSKDNTVKICREYRYPFVDLSTNLGLAGGFQTGMKYAWQKGYNYAVQFDGDGQHRPEYIQAMKEKMDDEGY